MRSYGFISVLCKVSLAIAVSAAFVFTDDAPASTVQDKDAGKRRASRAKQPDVPLRITTVRKLQGDDWIQNLEVDVVNESDRPIYFFQISLLFPDMPLRNGGSVGTSLTYGNHFLMNRGQFAMLSEVPFMPGEEMTLKLPEAKWKGLLSHLTNAYLPMSVTNRVVFYFNMVSFGDGTGYKSGRYFSDKVKSFNHSPQNRTEEFFAKNMVRVGWTKTNNITPVPAITPLQHGCGGSCSKYDSQTISCPGAGSCFMTLYSTAPGNTNKPCAYLFTHTVTCMDGGISYYCPNDLEFLCTTWQACGGATCPGQSPSQTIQNCSFCVETGGQWIDCECDYDGPGMPINES